MNNMNNIHHSCQAAYDALTSIMSLSRRRRRLLFLAVLHKSEGIFAFRNTGINSSNDGGGDNSVL